MAGPGLESKNSDFQDCDKNLNLTDIKKTHLPEIKNIKKESGFHNLENTGQILDSLKLIIDTFRAQYEHNESPKDIIKLIKAWPKIPKNVAQGIIAMIDCYLD